MDADSETLNPHHKRRLRTTCEHVDSLLSEVEIILNASESQSPFPKYIGDIGPRQRNGIQKQIGTVRAELLKVLSELWRRVGGDEES